MNMKIACRPVEFYSSVGSLTSRRRHTIRRGNGNVQEIANAKLGLGQRLVVIDSLLSCAGDTNFTHLKMIVAIIWEHNGKVEIGSLLARIRINVAHQRR